MVLTGELVGRLNAALGLEDRALEMNAAACRYAQEIRGADIGNPYQSEANYCLNLANGTEGVGFGRLVDELGLRPDQLAWHDDIKLLIRANSYDAEQHYFPNAAVSNVMGALPGSDHPVVFHRDAHSNFVYLPQTINHEIYATAPTLTDTAEFVVEAEAVYYVPGGSAGRHLTRFDGSTMALAATGQITFFDGTGTDTSASTVGALLSISVGDPFEARAVVSGTDLDVDVRVPGGSWVSALSGITIAGQTLSGGQVNVGSHFTTNGISTRFYHLKLRDGGTSAAYVMEFLPSLFAAGNRGHASTAVDAYGITWTLQRSGAPLSVIDTGDGLGKRLRFTGTTGNYLTSSLSPDLSSKDLFFWFRGRKSTLASIRTINGQWGGAGARVARLRINASEQLEFQKSTDGTANVAKGMTEPSWFSSDEVGYIGMFYDDATGDLTWYDGGQGTSPSFSFIETDTSGVSGIFNGSGLANVRVGETAVPDQPMSGDILEAGIGASPTSLYDHSHFDAALIDRRQWRIDRTVDSDVAGEEWAVTFTDDAEDANDPVLNSAVTEAVFSASHWLSVPHHPDLDADPVTVGSRWTLSATATAWAMLYAKKADSVAATVGYNLQRWDTDARVFAAVADGSGNQLTSSGNNITEDTAFTAVAVHSPTDQELYIDGATDASDTPSLGSAATTQDLRIGADGSGGGGLNNAAWHSLAVLSKRVTDAEALATHNELAAT